MRSIILSAMLVLLVFGNAVAQSDVVFSDDFYSNTNNWYEGSTKDYYFKVQNGYYTFDNTSETTWMIAKDVGLSAYDNFSAEATIKKVSGIDNNLYGIVWGYKTSNDCYTFGLSGDGNYLYGKWSNGNWISLISWTLSSSINKYAGAVNTIRVERNGSTVSFYINGTFVNSATWETPLGSQVGFVSTNRQRMDVDKLTVRKITGSSQYSSYGGGGGSFDAVLKNTVSYQLSGEYNRGGAISPDGQKFAIGGKDGQLKVFSSEGSFLKSLTGHTSWVNGLAFSSDGQKLASACSDKTMKIWDVNGGYVIRTFSDFTSDVIAVSFSSDGRYVAAGGFDKLVKVYDVQGGYMIKTLYGHNNSIWSVQFSPDGKYLMSGDSDGNIKVWSTSSWLQEKTGFQSGWITSIRFTSDGQKVVTTSYSNTVKVWNFPGMVEQKTMSHTGSVWMATISPDNKYVVSSGADKVAKVWDINTGTNVKTLYGHTANIGVVLFSSDGQKLITASDDNSIKLWTVSGVGGKSSSSYTSYTQDYSSGGGELVVAKDGSGQYATIQAAVNAASYGSVIRVKAGKYYETVEITKSGVTIKGDGAKSTFIDGGSATTIKLTNVQNIKISGLAITNNCSSDPSAGIWMSGSSAEITNNLIYKCGDEGINGKKSTMTVTNNTIVGNGRLTNNGVGVYVDEGSTATIKSNIVVDNTWGIYVYSGSATTSYNNVYNNKSGNYTSVTSQFANITQYPSFTNPGSDDYTLTSYSPCKGKAENGKDMGVAEWGGGSYSGSQYSSYGGGGGSFDAVLKNTVSYQLSGEYNRGGAISPDGQKFAIGGKDGQLKVFSSEGSFLKSLTGHTSWVNGLAFSSDGQKLASACSDKTMKIWDVNGGYVIRTFSDFTSDVIAVSFSSDGRYVAAGGFDKLVKVYDVQGGYMIKTLYGHNNSIWSVQFSPDGKYLMSGDSDGNIKVWSTSSWLQEKTGFQSGWITSIRFTSDGQKVVTTSYSNTVKVWNFPGMVEQKTMSHTGSVWMATISPDNKYVVSSGADKVAKVWDINTGTNVKTLYGHTANIGVVLFSSDGQKLITASDDNSIKLWTVSGVGGKSSSSYTSYTQDYSSGGGAKTLNVAKDGSGQYSTIASAIAAARDGDEIKIKAGTYYESNLTITTANIKLTGDGPEKSIIDGSGSAPILAIKANGVTVSGFTFKNSTGSAGAIQMNQSNATFKNNVVRDNQNYGMYIWGGTPVISNNTFYKNCGGTYAQEQDVIGLNSGASAIIKNNVFYANNGGSAIDNEGSSYPTITYNIIYTSGQSFKRCYGGAGNIFLDPMLNTYDFTLNTGSPAISKGEYGTSMGILTKGSQTSDQFAGKSSYTGNVDATLFKTLYGHTGKVRAVDISADGKFIASGEESGSVFIWDAVTGTKLKTLSGHTSWVNGIAFNPDGGVVASAGSDKNVILWNVNSGTKIQTLSGHTDLIVPVEYSPNGRLIASGGFDNSIRIWDGQTGALIRTLTGHKSSLWGMAFSSDGNLLATGDTDGEILLWNTTTWVQIRKMKSSSSYNWIDGLAFSLDGKYLYVGEYNNNISVWDVATGISIKTLSGHTNHVWGIAISPDGKVLASASADRTVKLWDLGSGTLIKTLTDPKDELFNIAFSRDGSKLVASSDDKNVYVWTMKGITGAKIETFTQTVTALPPYLTATATFADADGDNLLKGGESGKVTLVIKNTGKGPALGVNAKFTITEGSLGLYLGTPTFYAGDIQPGAEKTITTTVDATEDVLTQKVSMKVEATEKNGFGADAIIVNFNTKTQEPPLLAVSKYVLRDDGSGQSQGNGDGMIQKKETIELTVFLTNTGQGAANNVKLTLKSSDPGIFISQSASTLGDIPPGEVKKGVFVFAVSGNYSTVSSTLPLSMEISEKRVKFNKSENLGLSLDASYKKEVVVDVVSNFKEENKTISMGNIKDKVDQAVKDMNLAISKSGVADIELPPRENVYAVVIGISEYKSKDVPPLTYAVNDASGVYALLTNNVIGGIPKSNVKFLAGPEATLTEIKVALGWLVNQGMEDENAVLMFYYSGHGAPEQDDEGNVKTAFLIPFDGQPKFLAETGIGIDYLQQELGKVKAKNVFVAMDACFTGSGRSFMKQGARGINLVPKEIIKETVEGKVFLTAAANDQSAFDDPQNKHGLFTNFLLEALSGNGDSDSETGNNDGWVSSNEVFNYLKDRVSKAARKLENVKQDPQMIGSGEIKLTRTFQKKAGSMTVDEKKSKLGKALNSAAINMDQYAKALTEIKSGNESAVLKDFLAGKIDAKKFGESY